MLLIGILENKCKNLLTKLVTYVYNINGYKHSQLILFYRFKFRRKERIYYENINYGFRA